jgi:hypothetical protein
LLPIKEAQKGREGSLDAKGSYDPDGNQVSYTWWIYHEASSADAIIKKAKGSQAVIKTSALSRDGEVHLILEVKDEGTPTQVSYRSVILRLAIENSRK